jgi:hypothetical protein
VAAVTPSPLPRHLRTEADMTNLTERLRTLLQAEPLRAIAYGAAFVVWTVAAVAQLIGYTKIPPVDFATALIAATTAAGAVAEVARRFVYSPASVAEISRQTPPGAGEAVAAAIEEGSPPVVKPADLPGGSDA